ncbi:MAG: toll/interleukin-1 receptor domain-containing protein, partial [Chloroflexi bacterium]|nr:toll/interleukin-1 receptor domain-containing protein [Chloroflexota bacterium]
MSQNEPQKDFFISYNKADKGWAEWVAWQLEAAKYTTVIQAWDFKKGGNFVLDMQRAAGGCERLIAIFSSDYLTSMFTAPEWAAFFANDPTGEKGLLVPVKVRDCKPDGLLRALVYIDLTKEQEDTAAQALLDGIKRVRTKPTIAPRFPGQGVAAQTANGSSPAPRYPGTFPPIWNIPHRRNEYFTGREDLLDALEKAQTSAITQAVAGLGGVGKTQTAVEYAYRNKERFELVWWVNAEFATSLRSDLADLAFELTLATPGATEQAEAIDLALRYLHTCPKPWLLVLDNVEEPADILHYMPNGGNGQTLITSRYNGDWGKS